MKTEQIAKIAHEVNRAYCQALGDESQLPWEEAPEWQKQSAIDGAYHHVYEFDVGQNSGPQHSHEVWLKHKLMEGWKYGPIKDSKRKEHPCMVPYEDLPVEQQAKDYIFQAVCRQLAAIRD